MLSVQVEDAKLVYVSYSVKTGLKLMKKRAAKVPKFLQSVVVKIVSVHLATAILDHASYPKMLSLAL